MLTEREPVTAEALKLAIRTQKASPSQCFIKYCRALVEDQRKGNFGRYKRESTVLNKLEAFSGSPLPFKKITPQFLSSFEKHLVEELGNKASTIQTNLSVVRAYFRRAIRESLIPSESDPFHTYAAAKSNRPERPKLSASELVKIERLDLGGIGPSAPLIARVRDTFLFSLYGAGIRFADLARLRRADIADDLDEEGRPCLRLTYTMGKTGKPVSFRLMPKAEAIARAFFVDERGLAKPGEAFLFPVLTGYDLSTPQRTWNALSAQNALANKYLRKIADQAGISCRLSFHIARHSFADLARKKGWDVYAISKALAHSGLAVTERYLAGFDSELIDAKMAQLFDDDAGEGE